VFAFAGLADNEQFFDSLRDLQVAGTRGFPDHHRYTEGDVEQIRRAAATSGAGAIVTTEKDAVKLRAADITAIPAEFIFDAAVLEKIDAVARP
jgi:tetraacyldisaccharide 4'-kinase